MRQFAWSDIRKCCLANGMAATVATLAVGPAVADELSLDSFAVDSEMTTTVTANVPVESSGVDVSKPRSALSMQPSVGMDRAAAPMPSPIQRPLTDGVIHPQMLSRSEQSGARSLRKLPVPKSAARTLATKLNLIFRDEAGVTITPDASRGQLVVMAPPHVHQRIAAEVGRLSNIETPTQRTRIVLQNTSAALIERLLGGLSSRPLATLTRGGGGMVIYNLAALDMPATSLEIDRRSNHIVVDAPADKIEAWKTFFENIDGTPLAAGQELSVVRIEKSGPGPIQRAVRLLTGTPAKRSTKWTAKATAAAWKDRRSPFRPAMFQQADGGGDAEAGSDTGGGTDVEGDDGGGGGGGGGEGSGVFGDVQIQFVPELGQVIIRGSKKDVQRVREVIAQIEEQSEVTKPDVEVVPLQHVDSNALAELLEQIYEDVLSARQGQVSVTALDNPNSLLLIGRTEAIRSLRDLIDKLDQPSGETSRLRVYRLQHASAADAEETIRAFFTNQPGSDEENRPALGTRVRIQADYRTNSLIVSASPRDLQEVTRLINDLDVKDIPAQSELKVFPLNNAVAEDLAETILDAITGELETGAAETTVPSTTLSILAVDAGAGTLLQSGVLAGASVTPDSGSNSLIIKAPATAMPLITELIRQLDVAPDVESLVKVFTIENGDALQLTAALQDLFGEDAATTGTSIGGGNLAGLPPSTAAGDSSLVPLRFSAEQRTNSIIASGSAQDLEVVESILLRLDTSGFAERITEVIWLRHQSAQDIATALQTYISQRQQAVNVIQQFQQGLGVYDLPDRDLIVVAEPVSNSLLISVAPRLYEDVRRLVDQLDRRPPMVMIKVLLAEVSLNDAFEIGGELGLQDSLLFDRSVAANGVGISQNSGFNFNNNNTANSVNSANPVPGDFFNPSSVAARSVSTFGVGTSSAAAGFGGFVLSAASESVSLLLRTLQNANRLQILSRPQVMTLDNTEAFVQVGRQVARITGVINNGLQGTQVVTEDIEVGLILRVLPRVGADGLIVMNIDATRSERDVNNGTTIPTGDPDTPFVTIDDILRTTAQSVVAAYSGQTVVFGGLIQKSRNQFSRRVPYLADIPLIGYFFKFDSEQETRNELLVILTPMLVTGEEDLEYVKQTESARMSWCLADVVEMHGDVGLSGGYGLWGPAIGPTIYPDAMPTVDAFNGPVSKVYDDAGIVVRDPITGAPLMKTPGGNAYDPGYYPSGDYGSMPVPSALDPQMLDDGYGPSIQQGPVVIPPASMSVPSALPDARYPNVTGSGGQPEVRRDQAVPEVFDPTPRGWGPPVVPMTPPRGNPIPGNPNPIVPDRAIPNPAGVLQNGTPVGLPTGDANLGASGQATPTPGVRWVGYGGPTDSGSTVGSRAVAAPRTAPFRIPTTSDSGPTTNAVPGVSR